MIFTLNVPIGIVGMSLGSAWLRETERIRGLKFDLRGFVLSAVGFSALLLGLSDAGSDGWTSPGILVRFALGLVCLVAWVWVELTDSQPLLELRLFKNRTFALAMLVTFVLTVGMFGTAIFVTLLQARQTFHGNVLAQGATSSNFTLQQTLGQVQQWVLLHGGSALQAQADGLLLVMQQLQRTAAVQAFDDVFMVTALVTLLALVPALFIGGKAGRSGHAEPSLVLE